MCRPQPKTVRDLRMMYDTCGHFDGNIEYKRLVDSDDMKDGDIISIALRVVPDMYDDNVRVEVRREQVCNVRKGEYAGVCYSSKYLVGWSKTYTFDDFVESPFYDLMMESWYENRSGMGYPLYWDTSKMDEHEVRDNDTSWYISAHVYNHRRTFLNNLPRSGTIDAVEVDLDEDGGIGIYLGSDEVYVGNIWKLQSIVDRYYETEDTLKKLSERGIDLESGVLSIKLWEEGNGV